MSEFATIVWNIDPVIFQSGNFRIAYYPIIALLSLVASYFITKSVYKRDGLPLGRVDSYILIVFPITYFASRIGYCLCFEFGYYSHHILEIFIPFGFENGTIVFKGYSGFFLVPGLLGGILSVWIYSRVYKENFLYVTDRSMLFIPIIFAFYRFANLFNSEHIGIPTDSWLSIVYPNVDNIARHPAQIYEMLGYFAVFVIGYWFYRRKGYTYGYGFIAGMVSLLIYVVRFLVEFIKEGSYPFPDLISLNTAQLVCIPMALVAVAFMLVSQKNT